MNKFAMILAILSFLVLPAQTVFADLEDGLVAYYPFNGNANDASGNGNHGVVHGATLTQDKDGNADSAYAFGGSDYIEAPDDSSLDLSDAMTMAAWVKIDGSWPGKLDGGRIICKRHDVVGYGYTMVIKPGREVSTWTEYHDHCDTAQALGLEEWTHVATTYSTATQQIVMYINGDEVASESATRTMSPSGYPLRIGAQSDTLANYFLGTIDEVRIYNRTLTADEISTLYTIPEPCTISLLAVGGIALLRKRKH